MSAALRFDRAPRRVYWELTKPCDPASRHRRADAAPAPDPAELTKGEGDLIHEPAAGTRS